MRMSVAHRRQPCTEKPPSTGQRLARDVARRRAGQEQDDRRHVVGRAEPAHRGAVEQGRGELVEGEHGGGHVGLDDPRRHRVDPDPVPRPGHGQPLGELHHRRFGRAVGGHDLEPEEARHRADVDDAGPTVDGAGGQKGLARRGEAEGPEEVGGDDLLEHLGLPLVAAAGQVLAGVVDEDVEPVQVLARVGRCPLHRSSRAGGS